MTPEERQRIIEEEKIRTIVREKEKAKVELFTNCLTPLIILAVLVIAYYLFNHH